MPETSSPAVFESALAELEQLVKQMEQGDLTLEESLTAYERGIALGRQCQDALKTAELRIQELRPADTKQGATLEPVNLDAQDGST